MRTLAEAGRVLGALEEQVMAVFWISGPLTVREVCSRLKKRPRLAYTTVMTTTDQDVNAAEIEVRLVMKDRSKEELLTAIRREPLPPRDGGHHCAADLPPHRPHALGGPGLRLRSSSSATSSRSSAPRRRTSGG